MSEHACTALPNTRISRSVGLLWQNRGHGDDKRQSKLKRYRRETKYSTISQPQQVYKLTITYEKSGINCSAVPINCGVKRNSCGAVWINCSAEQFYIICGTFQPVLVQVLLLIVLCTTVLALKLFGRLATWFQVTSFLMANQ